MSSSEQPTFSHSGQRYLLGYTSTEYGIWDRQAPGGPVQRYPKSDQGWADAWAAYQSFESGQAAPPSEPTPPTQVAPSPEPAPPAAPPPQAAPAPQAAPPPAFAPAPAYAPTTQLPPAVPAGPGFQVTPKLVAQVLRIVGWVLLGLLPLQGIALLTSGGTNFFGIMSALADIALGPAFWGICTALAGVVERD
jgi:hypothetical protein